MITKPIQLLIPTIPFICRCPDDLIVKGSLKVLQYAWYWPMVVTSVLIAHVSIRNPSKAVLVLLITSEQLISLTCSSLSKTTSVQKCEHLRVFFSYSCVCRGYEWDVIDLVLYQLNAILEFLTIFSSIICPIHSTYCLQIFNSEKRVRPFGFQSFYGFGYFFPSVTLTSQMVLTTYEAIFHTVNSWWTRFLLSKAPLLILCTSLSLAWPFVSERLYESSCCSFQVLSKWKYCLAIFWRFWGVSIFNYCRSGCSWLLWVPVSDPIGQLSGCARYSIPQS